jgi:hypothetical protein
MTSINALICNKKKGPQIWSGDELETSGGTRQGSISEKMYQLCDKTYLMGGAGSVSLLANTLEEVQRTVKEQDVSYARKVEDLIKDAYSRNYEKRRDEIILIPLSITWDDVKKGTLNLEIRDRVWGGVRQFEEMNRCDFLTGGKLSNDEEFKLSVVNNTVSTGRQYYAIGSGMDISDYIIRSYLERMKLEERKDIPPHLGIRMIVEASQGSRENVGVGGTGQIGYVDENGVRMFTSDEVRLLHNVVFDEKTGLLDKETVDKIIIDTVGKTKEVSDVLKDLEGKVDHKKFFREHYTGRLQKY